MAQAPTASGWRRGRQMGLQWLFDIAGPFHISGAVVLLPFIQDDYAISTAAVAWAVVVYFLSSAVFTLPAAYLGNAAGRKKLVLIGVAIDMLSQFALFLAPPFWLFVLVRMAGGAGNAMVVPNLNPITIGVFPRQRRGRAIGYIMLGLGFGIVLSTVVAGVIADAAGWRYLFLLTGVMYTALFAGVALFSRESEAPSSLPGALKRMDYSGMVLLTALLVCLTVGVQRLGSSLTDPLGWSLGGVAIPLAAVFVYAERRAARPLAPLDLFAQKGFSAAVGQLFTMTIMRSAHAFLLPFYLIQGLGWSGSLAGSIQIALNAGQPVFGPIVGALADRTGARVFILLAQALMAGGTIALMSLGAAPGPVLVALSLGLIGASLGVFRPPNLKVIYDAVPPERMSLAPGVQVLTAHTSNAIGSSFVAVMLAFFLSSGAANAAAYRNSLLVMLAGFLIVNGAIWLFVRGGRRRGARGSMHRT